MTYATVHDEPGAENFLPGCGGLIFFLDHKPVEGEIMSEIGVHELNGYQPSPDDGIFCGTCGEPVGLVRSSTAIEVGDPTEYFADVARLARALAAVVRALQADG